MPGSWQQSWFSLVRGCTAALRQLGDSAGSACSGSSQLPAVIHSLHPKELLGSWNVFNFYSYQISLLAWPVISWASQTVLICWNPQAWWGVLQGSWWCTLIAADLHSVPSHFVTQAHVQNLSSHRIYKTCRVSPGRFRANAFAVISSISCSGLFWHLIVRCDSHWIQRRLLHFYSTSVFALFWSFMTVLVAVYQC